MSSTRYGRRAFLQASGTGTALALAGCLGGSPAERRTVEMTDDLAFEPASVTVARGGTVIWENVGGVEHTVTAYGDRLPSGGAYFASGGFASERAARNDVTDGLIGPDEAYAHTFETAGPYEYFCIPHESSGMTGTVRVR